MNTSDNQYFRNLEKQNEKIQATLKKLSIVEEKFSYCKEVIDARLKDLNKNILKLHSDASPYKKELEKVYEEERKYILGLSRDLMKIQSIVDNE